MQNQSSFLAEDQTLWSLQLDQQKPELHKNSKVVIAPLWNFQRYSKNIISHGQPFGFIKYSVNDYDNRCSVDLWCISISSSVDASKSDSSDRSILS